MTRTGFKHIYGPLLSRRLGRSLGIDIMPYKICTYDCIYCQLGRSTNKTIERRNYVAVGGVIPELERVLEAIPAPDYISISGSGEPTLNLGIGDLIRSIKCMTKIPVAVLTNGALLWKEEVRDALMAADLVLPSLDAGDVRLFRYVNRPHTDLNFDIMVDGLTEFTASFSGKVWLEIMLLDGVTGIITESRKIADLVKRIKPDRVQLNTAIRPPVEDYAFQISSGKMEELSRFFPGKVEVIIDKEKCGVSHPSNRKADDREILSLLERRPCRVQDISSGLGLNINEVVKRLEMLGKKSAVKSVYRNKYLFYEKTGDE